VATPYALGQFSHALRRPYGSCRLINRFTKLLLDLTPIWFARALRAKSVDAATITSPHAAWRCTRPGAMAIRRSDRSILSMRYGSLIKPGASTWFILRSSLVVASRLFDNALDLALVIASAKHRVPAGALWLSPAHDAVLNQLALILDCKALRLSRAGVCPPALLLHCAGLFNTTLLFQPFGNWVRFRSTEEIDACTGALGPPSS